MKAVTIPKNTFHLKALLFFEAITLGSGLLGGILGGTSGFHSLSKPLLTPPANIFPIAWTILYMMMGFAAYLIWNANDIDGGRVLRLYLLQLLLVVLWQLFIFRMEWRLFSFFWILLLIALVTLVMAGFKYINKTAYILIIPYLLWLLYNAYLNLGFYLLNA